MNPALKTLQDKHAAKSAEVETLVAQGQAETDPVKAVEYANKAKEGVDELNALKGQIETLQGLDGASEAVAAAKSWSSTPVTALPQPGAGATKAAGKTVIDVFTGKILDESGAGILTGVQAKAVADPDYLKAYAPFLRAGGELSKVKDKDARKFLSEGIDEDGGFLVPAEVLSGILMREPAAARILDLIKVVTISSDKAVMLKSNYTSDDIYSSSVRVYKTAEGATTQETNKPQFGTLTIDVHNFTAELSISRSLLEDTSFDIVGFITTEFRTAMVNHAAAKVLTGSGVGEHFGILTRAGSGANDIAIVKSGHASQITWDGLRRIKNAVPEQYDTNSKYVFNKKSTQDAIEALVDDNGRPLWPEQQRSGLEAGTPGTLQGYGYVREARMPDIAANALAYLFGDLQGYIRALRLGMTIEPLRELEARRGQVVFLARFREGGDVAEPWRMRVGKIAA